MLDEIRRRARELNLTMVDLDQMARTGGYFTRAQWVSKKAVDPQNLLKAVLALGGSIPIQWDAES